MKEHFNASHSLNYSFKVGILTCSTSFARKLGDESSQEVRKILQSQEPKVRYRVEWYKVVPDRLMGIASILKSWCDIKKLDLILTTGGTGFSPTDVTPEATKSILEKEAPGIAEAMRLFSSQKKAKSEKRKIFYGSASVSFLSRGVCGIRKKTLIVNLPGSPRGARESLEAILPILPHALELVRS